MLQEIGPPVFLGGLTTFLGIAPLAASNSAIFRTFFKMFFGIIVYGVGHGLILMPVILSLFGPVGGTGGARGPKTDAITTVQTKTIDEERMPRDPMAGAKEVGA